MANKKTKTEETPESNEAAATPQPVPASPAAPAAAPVRQRAASEPKRLSKGARKHLRRQKQAGEYKPGPRR